ncbi:RHS repeat protein, partial [Thauera sinica]
VMLRNPDYTQVDYQYDPAGRMLSRVTANGARSTYQYEANGTLTRETQYDAANTLVSDTTYTRDRVGHILTRTDGAGTTTYAYDALYRLKTADYPGATNDEAFTYDAVGNRLTHTRGSLAPNANTRYYSYTAGTNRLLDIRIGGTGGTVESSFVHDHEGRLTSQTGAGAKALTWDAKGRLKTAGAESYVYDPMDYRIGRSGGSLGSRSYFLEGEHLESVERGGELVERYFRGAGTDELVAGFLKDGEGKTKPYLFHHDALTNTTAVTGHNGGTIQHIAYGAFGNVLTNSGSSPNRLKYTGREDDGNGCYYYRARYYCLGIDRFISEDPLGFAAGDVNFYAYVGNNPVNANDPSGEAVNLFAGAGGAIIGGIGGGMTAFIKSGGDWSATWKGALAGGVFGAVAGLTFGASVAASSTALVAKGAAIGVASAAGGSASGQFFGNRGQINLTEVGVTGALGAIPGGAQGALKAVALSSGLSQSTANTLGSLGLVAQLKVGTTAAGVGIGPVLPEYNLDLSKTYSTVNSIESRLPNLVSSGANSSYASDPSSLLKSVYNK